jgi:small subunit ribosomal protein S2
MSLLNNLAKTNYSSNQVTFSHLFSYGVHKGTTLKMRNVKMDEFLFGYNQNNDTIFNLDLCTLFLRRTLSFLKFVKKNEGQILFIGTSGKTQKLTKMLGESAKQPYIVGRWINGLLTNWENISSSIKLYNLFLKKLQLSRKRKTNLENSFGGLCTLKQLPSAIFLLDLKSDGTVINEAKQLGIPVIAFVDNSSDLFDQIDYPIPMNTGSTFSIFLISSLFLKALKD